MRFVTKYRDVLETLLGFGGGDLLAVDNHQHVIKRYENIIGRKFILPIVIDSDYSGDMTRYELVPDVFRTFQYGHAPAGRNLPPPVQIVLRFARSRAGRQVQSLQTSEVGVDPFAQLAPPQVSRGRLA